jgi:hypothetical protein
MGGGVLGATYCWVAVCGGIVNSRNMVYPHAMARDYVNS